MSNFVVRRISQHNINTQKQKTDQKLVIQPNHVLFKNQQATGHTLIQKIRLTNLFNHLIQLKIKQPRENFFKIKCGKNILAAGQSVQIFVFYNLQAKLGFYNDQFIISTTHNQIYNQTIPIFVRNAEQIKKLRKTQRKSSKANQNLKIIKLQTFSRHVGQNKRKAGIILSNHQIKNTQQQQSEINTLSGRIQKFLKQYAKIQNFLKDKAIKNEIYKGEKPVTKQKIYEIISFNLTIQMMTKQQIKQQIFKRYKNKKTRFGPSVRPMQNLKLQWNKNRNQPKITYKKGLQKLFRQIRNFVIYHRFKKMNKILSIYRNLRQQQNTQQPQTRIIIRPSKFNYSDHYLQYNINRVNSNENMDEQSIILNQNNEDRQYQLQIEQKKKHDYYCRKISKIISNKKQRNLGADFTQFSIGPKLLPIDYHDKIKNHLFQIKPRIGFDNWVTLEESTVYNHQLMKYNKVEKMYQWQCYPCFQYLNKKAQKNKYNNNHNSLSNANIYSQYITIQQNWQAKKQVFQTQSPVTNLLKKEYKQALKTQQTRYKNYHTNQKQTDFLIQQGTNSQLDIKKPYRNNSYIINQIKCMKEDYLCEDDTLGKFQVQRFLGSSSYLGEDLIYRVCKQDMVDFDQPTPTVERKIQYVQYLEDKYNQQNSNFNQNYYNNLNYNNNNYSQYNQYNNFSNHMNYNNFNDNYNQYHNGYRNANANSLLVEYQQRAQQKSRSQIINKKQSCNSNTNSNTNSSNNNNSISNKKWEVQRLVKKDRTQYEQIIQNINKNKQRKMRIGKNKIESFNAFVKNKNNIFYF